MDKTSNKIPYHRFVKECQTLKNNRQCGLKIRFGQFFCNTFPWLNTEEPDLFYMEDDKQAAEIVKKYVLPE